MGQPMCTTNDEDVTSRRCVKDVVLWLRCEYVNAVFHEEDDLVDEYGADLVERFEFSCLRLLEKFTS